MTTDPNLVRNISCFRDLSKDQIKNIAQIANAVCYPPNQVLFKEGEPGQNLYFLVKAKLKFYITLAKQGRSMWIPSRPKRFLNAPRSSNLIHIQLRCAPRLRLRF